MSHSTKHSEKHSTSFTQSRRNFLKGAAYTSALSMGGVSSLAFAAGDNKTLEPMLSENTISVMQQPMLHKETVSLFNNTDYPVALNAAQPVIIERVSGSLIVKPNVVESHLAIADKSAVIVLAARERLAFDIQTTGGVFSCAEIADTSKLAGEQLHITSAHSAFNTLIPVSSAEASFA